MPVLLKSLQEIGDEFPTFEPENCKKCLLRKKPEWRATNWRNLDFMSDFGASDEQHSRRLTLPKQSLTCSGP
jgi:hypothetical protein